ncbi:TetR/AcrR family transcriptional regulator [Agrobacterium vitis]|uniref:TetR/AcrR family transcriptional regulator n=1 Tax=Agrobacterium vitis TaxID=373 RepID=UPI0008733FF1|nr:TetR/AcrR family transcriptional regulator [Agrobacterium vitis]MCE6076611.1 TetR family transcriptional regulator [Agrobacterium vitis]MCM2452011.1 TetR/AcrR family transcriptional regulator [Agrobacterium vitis]MCM2470985.1 TetR/AcrR family transcriptional regulator [Agrobacterium vitis]MUO70023.1 TetR family transcriptional regulator [Agrobacterium vitis]MUO84897.1 TetR family transcriptional regulator [Agrobacterium vitis]
MARQDISDAGLPPVDTVAGRRRNSVKGAARREEILQAALNRFAKDGFQNAAIADIAEDVGLSLPGLLHYFPTKVDLLLAILERRDKETAPDLNKKTPHWRDFLGLLVEVTNQNMQSEGVVRAFSILNAESLLAGHPAQAWFHKRSLQLRHKLASIFAEGILNHEIKSDIDPQGIATEIIGLMDGLQMLWLRLPDSTDMGVLFSAYVERLIASIEVSEKP